MWLIITGVEHSGKTANLVKQACATQGVHVAYAHCSVWPDHSPIAYECMIPLAVSRDWLVLQDRAWVDEWVYSYAQSRQPHFDSHLVEWGIGRLLAYHGVACITTIPYTKMQRGDPPLHLCLERYETWSKRYPHWRLLDRPLTLEIVNQLVEEARERSKTSIHRLPFYTGPTKPKQIIVGDEWQIEHATRYAPPLWSRPSLASEIPPSEWPYTAWARSEIPREIVDMLAATWKTHHFLAGGAIRVLVGVDDIRSGGK